MTPRNDLRPLLQVTEKIKRKLQETPDLNHIRSCTIPEQATIEVDTLVADRADALFVAPEPRGRPPASIGPDRGSPWH
jgi:hypothetical protein